MQALWYGCANILIYFVIAVLIALAIRCWTPVPHEVFRKLLHWILLGSLWVWLFAFPNWRMSVISAVVFALAVYPLLALAEHIKGYSNLLTERRGGEIKQSLLVVFGMYAAVTAVCWGWLGDPLLALASIYAWGPGDAAAALIGKRFGKHPIPWKKIEGRKSFEGTAAMYLTSFCFVLGILLYRGGMPWYACFVTAALTAAVAALAELYSPNGNDTIICPVASMAALLPMIALWGGITA